MMSGKISNPQPDELWRLAIQQTALLNQGMNDNLAPIQKLVWVQVLKIPQKKIHISNQQRQNPFHLTEDLADAQGQFSEKTNFFQANCWPNQVNPAVIRAVDVVTGASATGTSNAYTC